MKTQTFRVPGATIYYESRGKGPLLLLIPGGPTDADTFAPLAKLLDDRFKVVTYDPRGNSRSVFDGEPVDQSLDVHGNDAAAIIAELDAGHAYIFGNSGGAQIGLNLCARYPHMVRKLIAHEPPCLALLEDAEELSKKFDGVVETYHREGAGAAITLFSKIAGMMPPARASSDVNPTQNQTPRSPFLKANLNYFLEHGVKPIARYLPEIEKLRDSRVVVGVGSESVGQLAHQTGEALARALGVQPIVFPGDHSGWLREPTEFAKVVATQFEETV